MVLVLAVAAVAVTDMGQQPLAQGITMYMLAVVVREELQPIIIRLVVMVAIVLF